MSHVKNGCIQAIGSIMRRRVLNELLKNECPIRAWPLVTPETSFEQTWIS